MRKLFLWILLAALCAGLTACADNTIIMNVSCDSMKNFLKKVKSPLDKPERLLYNDRVREKEDRYASCFTAVR